MTDRIPTTEKLAQALSLAGAPAWIIKRAGEGYYDDYKGHSAQNIHELVDDCLKIGTEQMRALATRAMGGEFDGQDWEAEEWARGPEGREVFKEFGL